MNIYKKFVEKKGLTGNFWIDIKGYWKAGISKLKFLILRLSWNRIAKKHKVINNQVMLITYQDKYACNPKYVCEKLLNSNIECKIVWACSKNTENLDEFPKQVKIVIKGTKEFYVALAESKFWIDNAHNFTWDGFPKKDEQILINLWHGSLGLKRIDPESDSNKHRKLAGMRSGKLTNYCISNSDFEEMVFRTSYWPNTEFKRFGHARNDIMFADDKLTKEIKNKVCKALDIDPKFKLLLYAPTFRDNNNFSCYNIDYNRLITALEKRFGGKWLILTRFHFHTQALIKRSMSNLGISESPYVISADSYSDIQEIMLASDVGITDYSSWICDFVLSKKPAFLFATDMDSYVTERGFYYDLNTTPFPIAENNEKLEQAVIEFNYEKYLNNIKKYLSSLGCCEDGHASQRIVNLIKEYIK